MSAICDFFEGLSAARGSSSSETEKPSLVSQRADDLGLRMVLYASGGSLGERKVAMAAAYEWAVGEGLTVVGSFHDDLVGWLAWNRGSLLDAVGLIPAGRADGLLVPHTTGARLTEADREWLDQALAKVGGRLVTAPGTRFGVSS